MAKRFIVGTAALWACCRHGLNVTTFKVKAKPRTWLPKPRTTSKAKVKDWTYKAKDKTAPWPCLEYLYARLFATKAEVQI